MQRWKARFYSFARGGLTMIRTGMVEFCGRVSGGRSVQVLQLFEG